MTWLKIDDQLAMHRKWRLAGVAGRAVWVMTAITCAAQKTDGVIESFTVQDAAYLAEVDAGVAVAALVASGLWHDHKTLKKCKRCKETQGKLTAGSFYFHDWLEYQPAKDTTKEPIGKWRERRKNALHKDTKLLDAIRDRDGTLCRYCGIRCGPLNDRRSPIALTYDHVDPDEWNSYENVAVACNTCNGRKNHRTPKEAGMPLLPPPHRALTVVEAPEPIYPRPTTEVDQNLFATKSRSDSEQLPTRAHARAGSGLVGSWSEVDRGGPGEDGSAPVGAGGEPDRAVHEPGDEPGTGATA